MNNSAKTLFCRAAFVVLVLLPTFATVSYVACGVWRPVEMTPSAWSSLLSEKTGLEIRIGKMRRDGNGVFVLEEFVIGDPESSATWITAPKVEVVVDGASLRLDASGLSVAASAVRKLGDYLQHQVLKHRKDGFQPLVLHATDGKLIVSEDDAAALPMPEFLLSTRWDEHGPAIDVKAELVDGGEPALVTLAANRHRKDGHASTRYRWRVQGEAGISTNVMGAVSPEWRSLGEYARFRGQIEGDESNYLLSGIEMEDIDLSLLGERWGMEGISGVASIGGERKGDALPGARIEYRDGRFADFFGEVALESGAIDGIVLARVAQALGVEAVEDFSKYQQVRFAKGAARLELKGENLRVSGDPKTGTILKSDHGTLVRLRTPSLRNARELTDAVFSEVHSEALPVSQWVAAMPAARSAAPVSAAKAPKQNKSR